ncbi:MAG: glycosyltransferase family 1 protein [Candidatus Hydrogenedentes bacterium]|nr:glycosyltransferase family 1 protein [Candidatus Hydrogenedentota bacterium]
MIGTGITEAGSSSLAARIPNFVRRIATVGGKAAALASALRPAREIVQIPSEPAQPAANPDSKTEVLPPLGEACDGIFLSSEWLNSKSFAQLFSMLTPNGFILFLMEPADASTDRDSHLATLGKAIRADGFAIYLDWGDALVAVRDSYNPVEHARRLFSAGHPGWAYEVLALIPESYRRELETAAVIAAEMQLCLLALDKHLRPDGRLERFFTAQTHFYEILSLAPTFHAAYQCQAEFWHRIGDDDMVLRLLRSIEYAAPSEAVRCQLDRYSTDGKETLPEGNTTNAVPAAGSGYNRYPRSTPAARSPRVLMITHERPNYGLDVLYDGLCRILGSENVVDFPWKPSLHGYQPDRLAHYPCLFDWPGTRFNLIELLKALRERQFDLILFGDIERHLERDAAQRIIEAAGDTPLLLVDQQDDPLDHRAEMAEYLAGCPITAYFKREMLACVDYGPGLYPLPFAYPDGRVPALSDANRKGVFWAGHRRFGLRRLYLEHLESRLECSLDVQYSQEDYANALDGALIGLNFFGFGYDTVRYWELPAHGCLLLAERVPIHIPYNFENGISAVFFDDLESLESKLDHFRVHPDEARNIAQAGYDHLRRYHTGMARARQMLAFIGDQLDVLI